MTVLLTRTLYSTNGPIAASLCSKWHQSVDILKIRLDLRYVPQKSLKTSFWNNIRRFEYNLSDQKTGFTLSSLKKPFCFTLAVSGLSIAGSAIWQYETIRRHTSISRKLFSNEPPKYGLFHQRMQKWWASISEADKVFVPICFINVLVFLAWQVPALRPVMTRYFLSGITSENLCWPMLLSAFSHYNILHIGANMYCLHSFTGPAVFALGKEQFMGVYLSAGVISSFTSLLFKTLTRSSTMSLGASGAVMCVLGIVCSRFPDNRISILFLPQFSIDAATGLKSLMCLDFIGCLMKWRFIDHAGHLGGSLFGVIWHHFGQKQIWERRGPLINVWHKIREPKHQ